MQAFYIPCKPSISLLYLMQAFYIPCKPSISLLYLMQAFYIPCKPSMPSMFSISHVTFCIYTWNTSPVYSFYILHCLQYLPSQVLFTGTLVWVELKKCRGKPYRHYVFLATVLVCRNSASMLPSLGFILIMVRAQKKFLYFMVESFFVCFILIQSRSKSV